MLLKAILNNQKRNLRHVDLNHNLVRCDPDFLRVIASFEPAFNQDKGVGKGKGKGRGVGKGRVVKVEDHTQSRIEPLQLPLQLQLKHNLIDTEAVTLFSNAVLRIDYIDDMSSPHTSPALVSGPLSHNKGGNGNGNGNGSGSGSGTKKVPSSLTLSPLKAPGRGNSRANRNIEINQSATLGHVHIGGIGDIGDVGSIGSIGSIGGIGDKGQQKGEDPRVSLSMSR